MIKNLINNLQEWNKKRRFVAEHKFRIWSILESDSRWLASDKTAQELIKRYIDLTSDDWYEKDIEDIHSLRTRLEMDHLGSTKKPVAVVEGVIEDIGGQLCRIKTIKILDSENLPIGTYLYKLN